MSMARTIPALLLALTAGPLWAQGLPDPTRPPPAFESGAAAPAAGAATPPTAPRLQSIIRRQGARSAVVINGVYVELGGKVGEATLDRVGEDSVDLRSTAGRETLYLTPGIGKQVVPAEAAVAKRPRGKTEKANRP